MTHPIVAVCSNKGGVGKTTFATNLAVYARALNDDLPVLLVGLDDQSVIDRMFRIRPPIQGEGHLKHGWAERSLDRVVQIGQYGVHFVPPPPDTGLLKHRAEDPRTLQRILAHTDFSGLVILDTKSDLEALTQNALHAAALAVLPVADWTSLEEAGKIFELRERQQTGLDARVLLTLVDRRTKVDSAGRDLYERLIEEIDARGWPRFRTHLSRSPRVESLISATRNPGSILHHARGTQVHSQMRDLTEEVLAALGLARAAVPAQSAPSRSPGAALKRAFLRGLGGAEPLPTFGILVGGGPAPGINGVIGAATILARRRGARVIGLLEGFRWLMEGRTDHRVDLQIGVVSRIHQLGGSILQTSRANPTKREGDLERVVAALEELGIDHLITIGGDDTAFSARRVAEVAEGRVRVAHVPKTIDNDLPLPGGIPTFGFETAREHATQIVSRLMEDARTTGRWYFVIMMGRSAGHLALGAAKAAGATLALIPEDFPKAVSLQHVVRTLEGGVVKRLAMGRPHGVAVIAEGVGLCLDPKDLEALDSAPRDEHGHVRLAEVPLGSILQRAVLDGLAGFGMKPTIVAKDVGYELRCAEPNAFDLDYTRDLGAGAVRTLLAGTSGVMITRQESAIVPVPFGDLMDPETGRTRVRVVDTSTESHESAVALQVRLEPPDLEGAFTSELARVLGISEADVRARYAELF